MNYKLAQLILTPGKNTATTSDIFISQPDAIKEALAGKLFLVIEINNNDSESLKIINYLVDNLNYNYYQSEKIIMRERMPSLKVEHIFEAALAKTNKYFSDYLESEKIRFDFSTINITAAVLHDNCLYFANTGKNKIFMVYKSRPEKKAAKTRNKNRFPDDEEGKQEYRIVSLDQNTKPSLAELGERKLFYDVISGRVPEKSALIFTNEALPEYISSQQLLKVTSTIPPVSAVEQLKIMLESINSYVSFLAVVVKNAIIDTAEVERSSPAPTARASIIDLNRTEEKTENLLSPSGVINFKKWFKLPAFNLPGLTRKNNIEGTISLSLKDKIIVKKKSMAAIGRLFELIKNTGINIINFIFFLGKTLTNRSALANIYRRSIDKTIVTANNSKNFLTSLSLKGKIFLAVIIVCIFVLIFNLVNIGAKNAKQKETVNWQNITNSIEQKQNQIDATLLYNNEEGAKKLFDEINSLLLTLPQDTDIQKAQLNEIKVKLNEQLAKMRRVVIVNEPDELANFINLNSSAAPENISFVPATNKIYAADSKQRSVYIIDAKNNMATSLTDPALAATNLADPCLTKNNTILYFNPLNNIVALDTNGDKITNLTLRLNTAEVAATDIYNNNLYLADKKNNQIYKTEFAGQAFSVPTNWLKEEVNLADTADISIDGQIYLLKRNGELIKLLKGRVEEFKLSLIDPPFTETTGLFVSPEGKNIYILEPKNKRLAVFDKTGNYVMQYQSEKFSDLRDFYIDEKNKVVYLLNGATVYKFSAEHLQ